MRIFNELMGRDQGVYLVRKEMKEIHKIFSDKKPSKWRLGVLAGIEAACDTCDDLLDIATLGEIER